ncbi:hypothetical protein [Streptomyces sp. NPDC091383]|uniref:hypothetical protein n=1 Tax=Streptomyces sp. NPDC091383 TaxID=3365996 RepID=UPI00381685FF
MTSTEHRAGFALQFHAAAALRLVGDFHTRSVVTLKRLIVRTINQPYGEPIVAFDQG